MHIPSGPLGAVVSDDRQTRPQPRGSIATKARQVGRSVLQPSGTEWHIGVVLVIPDAGARTGP